MAGPAEGRGLQVPQDGGGTEPQYLALGNGRSRHGGSSDQGQPRGPKPQLCPREQHGPGPSPSFSLTLVFSSTSWDGHSQSAGPQEVGRRRSPVSVQSESGPEGRVMTVISVTRASHYSMTGERAVDPWSPGLSPPCPHAPQLRQLLDRSRCLLGWACLHDPIIEPGAPEPRLHLGRLRVGRPCRATTRDRHTDVADSWQNAPPLHPRYSHGPVTLKSQKEKATSPANSRVTGEERP